MKKKILSIALVVCIAITAIAGATIAYLTDDDEATNTFTVGNVQIELVEQQRVVGNDGKPTTTLENFKPDKILLPLVGSVQDDKTKDSLGLTTAANYVDKIVTVNNIGASDAYIRVIVAVPAALDWSDGPLHWNLGNKFNGATDETYNAEVAVKCVHENAEITVNNEKYTDKYNIYTFTYKTPVEGSVNSGAESTPVPFAAIVGFYLDSSVDNYVNDNDKIVYTFNGEEIGYDLAKGVTVPVFAQAVQSAGFETAEDAFTAANLPTNPWAN